jgi:hypothetical protein
MNKLQNSNKFQIETKFPSGTNAQLLIGLAHTTRVVCGAVQAPTWSEQSERRTART